MHENDLLLNLLLTSPHAFLLYNYLKLKFWGNDFQSVFFPIDEIRDIGFRAILSKEQVRRNLKTLERLRYISVVQCPFIRSVRYVTILDVGYKDE